MSIPAITFKKYFNLFLTRVVPSFNFASIKAEHKECARFVVCLKQWTMQSSLSAIWFHPCNEVSNGTQWNFGSLLKVLGKINGVSDYVFLWNNGAGCIEFKDKGKKLNESQILFKEWCADKNVPYFEVYTTEEATLILKDWGILNEQG